MNIAGRIAAILDAIRDRIRLWIESRTHDPDDMDTFLPGGGQGR